MAHNLNGTLLLTGLLIAAGFLSPSNSLDDSVSGSSSSLLQTALGITFIAVLVYLLICKFSQNKNLNQISKNNGK